MTQKTTNKSARHSARIALVQALYQYEQTQANTKMIAREFINHRFDNIDQETNYFSPDQSYFQKLMEAIPLKILEIDDEIQKYLQEKKL